MISFFLIKWIKYWGNWVRISRLHVIITRERERARSQVTCLEERKDEPKSACGGGSSRAWFTWLKVMRKSLPPLERVSVSMSQKALSAFTILVFATVCCRNSGIEVDIAFILLQQSWHQYNIAGFQQIIYRRFRELVENFLGTFEWASSTK